jgi:hypothetical protein
MGRLFEGAHATRKVSITHGLPRGTAYVQVPIRPLPPPHLHPQGAYWYSHKPAGRL